MTRAAAPVELGTPPAWAARGFHRYNARFLGKSFSAVRVATMAALPGTDAPLVVYLNHPSWWDPLVGALLIDRLFDRRRDREGRPVPRPGPHWGLIDAAELERYRILGRFGFVGVEQGSRAGAKRFARIADAFGEREGGSLWLTPQARFADPRERPLALAPGLAWIARRLPRARFLPIALEYPFREEKLPEARVLIGEAFVPGATADAAADPTDVADAPGAGGRANAIEDLLADRLARTCDALAMLVTERRDERFDTLIDGRRGVGGLYDVGRRVTARLRGEAFEPGHARGAGGARDAGDAGGAARTARHRTE